MEISLKKMNKNKKCLFLLKDSVIIKEKAKGESRNDQRPGQEK
jgi:hypothetical protein